MARRIHKAARVYAWTLLELAESKGALAAVKDDMVALGEVFAKTKYLGRALQLPSLSVEKKTLLLKPLAENASEWTKRLLRLLEIKGRMSLVVSICAEFLRLEEEKRQIRRARVVSAAPLNEAQLKSLSAGLAAQHPGKTYLLHNDVDANLIAGFRVEEDDFVTDTSLRHKLNTLRQKLAA